MSALLPLIQQFRASGDATPLVQAIPYLRSMGIHVTHDAGEVMAHMPFDPKLIGNPTIPALHGGTIGALLEATSIVQVLWAADTLVLPKTINLTVDYLRSGTSEDTHARAVITKLGRRVINVHAEAWQADAAKPIATSQAHFLVKTPED